MNDTSLALPLTTIGHAPGLCRRAKWSRIGRNDAEGLVNGDFAHPLREENRMIQLVSLLATVSMLAASAAPDAKASLQGTWVAQSLGYEGKLDSSREVRAIANGFHVQG